MSMGLKRWSTRKLRPGDLTALAAIADGSAAPKETSVNRLAQRHFITRKADGRMAVTARGHVALMIARK